MNNKIKIILIIIISFICGILIYQNSLGSIIKHIDTNNVHVQSNHGVRVPTQSIIKKDIVKQYFIAKYNNLYALQIRIGNYGRVNTSTLCLLIKNTNTNNILYSKCQNSVNFVNNALYKMKFNNQPNSKNQKFLLKIFSTNGTSTNSVALWSFTNTNHKNNKLYINNKLQKNNLDIIQTYNNNYSFSQSLKVIYQKLYQKNPYFFKGRYIYLIVLLYPATLFILLTIFEFLFLYKKSIKNIIITNLIIGILLFSINYYVHGVQNLSIPNVTIVTPQ